MKFLTFGIVVATLFFGSMVAYPTWRECASLRLKSVELQERIRVKSEEIRTLRQNQLRFRTDSDFVEMIARQNRRVFPGELVFVFDE